jgi:internalin A
VGAGADAAGTGANAAGANTASANAASANAAGTGANAAGTGADTAATDTDAADTGADAEAANAAGASVTGTGADAAGADASNANAARTGAGAAGVDAHGTGTGTGSDAAGANASGTGTSTGTGTGGADAAAEISGALAARTSEPAPAPIAFAEPLIGRAVREFLGYDETRPVYPDDLRRVTALCIWGKEIRPPAEAQVWNMRIPWYNEAEFEAYRGDIASLADLAQCKNLRALTIEAQRIEDLSPLAGLPLEYLSVQWNPVKDVSVLAGLNGLCVLRLTGTDVADIAPVCPLPRLRQLGIENTRVDTLAPLAGIASDDFIELSMAFAPARDLEFLPGLGKLLNISLSEATDAELEALCGMPTLECVAIYFGKLTGIAPLARLDRLNYLSIRDNGNPLSIDGLERLSALASLDLFNTKIADYSPLFSMPALREVNVSADQANEIYAISPAPPFAVIF